MAELQQYASSAQLKFIVSKHRRRGYAPGSSSLPHSANFDEFGQLDHPSTTKKGTGNAKAGETVQGFDPADTLHSLEIARFSLLFLPRLISCF